MCISGGIFYMALNKMTTVVLKMLVHNVGWLYLKAYLYYQKSYIPWGTPLQPDSQVVLIYGSKDVTSHIFHKNILMCYANYVYYSNLFP